jgi:hypothetical protein
MAIVSITRLRIRSRRFMPGFFFYAIRTNLQARRAEGNLGLEVLREPGNVFWTATVWDSDAALKSYITSGAHGRAMRHLMNWCDEASVVRWEQASVAMPPWLERHRRMQADGRRSKVRFPSRAHERFEIPSPRS